MAAAISLWNSGIKDVVIVDGDEQALGVSNASRAIVIHAATLEVGHHCQHLGRNPF